MPRAIRLSDTRQAGFDAKPPLMHQCGHRQAQVGATSRRRTPELSNRQSFFGSPLLITLHVTVFSGQ